MPFDGVVIAGVGGDAFAGTQDDAAQLVVELQVVASRVAG